MAVPNRNKRRLTPATIASLRPRDTEYEVADGRSGLRLRVTPKGAKVFRWYVTSLGRVITIGRWNLLALPGHVTLAQARKALLDLREAYEAGTLDAAVRVLKEQTRPLPAPDAAPAAAGPTVASVAEAFLRNVIDKQRKRPEDARHIVEKDILSEIGPMPLSALRKTDCRRVVENVVARGAETHAGKVLQLLKQLLDYAENVEENFVNPAARLKAKNLGVVANRRQRVLDDTEIVLFWRALAAEPAPTRIERPDPRTGKVQSYAQRYGTVSPATRAALRLILLTGVRSCEILLAKWGDFDEDAATWTIPVANQKLTLKAAQRARPFVIPLSPTALDLFRDLRRIAGASPWVLASSDADGGHFTAKALGRAMRRIQGRGRDSTRLVLPGGLASPHDLRRTMRTGLARLGVPRDVAERCLNHSLGVIDDTYDLHAYLPERRAALEKWALFVDRLVNPGSSNVIPLPAPAALG